eukprot:6408158-Amphidinium_carterae.5
MKQAEWNDQEAVKEAPSLQAVRPDVGEGYIEPTCKTQRRRRTDVTFHPVNTRGKKKQSNEEERARELEEQKERREYSEP